VLTDADARDARERIVPGELILRLFDGGRVISLSEANACNVTELNASLSPYPRSAAAETATDADFLCLINSVCSSEEDDALLTRNYDGFDAALACDGLTFVRAWRTALHKAYSSAVECYPDASFANAVFTSRVSGGNALGELIDVFEDACSRAGVALPDQYRVLRFDLVGQVSDRFIELNRDHEQPSSKESAAMQGGEWVYQRVLFTRDAANRDRPLPVRTPAKEEGARQRATPERPTPIPPPPSELVAAAFEGATGRPSNGRVGFTRHDRVTIQLLKARPDLNGHHATVLGWDEASGRYMVNVTGGTSIKLKPECLLPHISEEGDGEQPSP
jgi:hypothetical protein